MEYADEHNIILQLNEKIKGGDNSLHLSICNKNIEMFKLILKYANENNIVLEINKKK